MKKKILLCLLLLFLLIVLSKPGYTKQIKINIDWAVFQLDQQHLLLEIYYSILQNEIDYKLKDGNLCGITLGKLKAYKDTLLVEEFVWKNQNLLQDSTRLQEMKMIIDRVNFKFEPGEYRFKLSLTDLQNPDNADSCMWELLLPTPDSQKPYLSDIEMASSILQDPQAKESPFYKNTLVVIPNPSLIYSETTPALFFYIESYNLTAEILPNGYLLNYYITDTEDRLLESPKPQKVQKKQALHPGIEFGVINVGRLKSGTYKLHVRILDIEGTPLASQSKKFYVYHKGEIFAHESDKDSTASFQSNIFQQMDSTQIEIEYLQTSYLMDHDTKKIWSKMDNLVGKKNFLFQFWRALDPDPTTVQNEFRQEFLRRIEFSDKNFRALKKEGWLTDRGRVYAVYGPPSDIEYYPNEPNYFPYEIW
ncbi:MAG: GWxTD domain-containing protein, partial [bacterium]